MKLKAVEHHYDIYNREWGMTLLGKSCNFWYRRAYRKYGPDQPWRCREAFCFWETVFATEQEAREWLSQ